MKSASQQAKQIQRLVEQLPSDLQCIFYRLAFPILIAGKVSMFQVDQLKTVYRHLEKQNRPTDERRE